MKLITVLSAAAIFSTRLAQARLSKKAATAHDSQRRDLHLEDAHAALRELFGDGPGFSLHPAKAGFSYPVEAGLSFSILPVLMSQYYGAGLSYPLLPVLMSQYYGLTSMSFPPPRTSRPTMSRSPSPMSPPRPTSAIVTPRPTSNSAKTEHPSAQPPATSEVSFHPTSAQPMGDGGTHGNHEHPTGSGGNDGPAQQAARTEATSPLGPGAILGIVASVLVAGLLAAVVLARKARSRTRRRQLMGRSSAPSGFDGGEQDDDEGDHAPWLGTSSSGPSAMISDGNDPLPAAIPSLPAEADGTTRDFLPNSDALPPTSNELGEI